LVTARQTGSEARSSSLSTPCWRSASTLRPLARTPPSAAEEKRPALGDPKGGRWAPGVGDLFPQARGPTPKASPMIYTQNYDPLHNALLSTLVAALPVL